MTLIPGVEINALVTRDRGDDGRRVIELIAQLAGGDAAVLIACHDQEVINLPGVVRLHLENGKLDR